MRTWDPYREMDQLMRELERVRSGQPAERGSQAAFLPGRSARTYPLINMSEDADNYYVEALAPGIDPSTLNLTVVRNQLSIAGEKRPPQGVPAEAFHRSERAAGKFVRSIDLPMEVESQNVSARYADGLLTITLP